MTKFHNESGVIKYALKSEDFFFIIKRKNERKRGQSIYDGGRCDHQFSRVQFTIIIGG